MSQQNEERLKPCPFCGGKPEEMVGGSHGSVGCRNEDCGAVIDIHDPTHDPYLSLNRARAAWNRRAPEHEKAAPTAEPVAWMLKWPSGNAELHFVGAGREWVEQRASITIAEDGPATITPLYTASPPPVSAEHRERLARLQAELKDMESFGRSVSMDIARDLAALCEEVMGKPTG